MFIYPPDFQLLYLKVWLFTSSPSRNTNFSTMRPSFTHSLRTPSQRPCRFQTGHLRLNLVVSPCAPLSGPNTRFRTSNKFEEEYHISFRLDTSSSYFPLYEPGTGVILGLERGLPFFLHPSKNVETRPYLTSTQTPEDLTSTQDWTGHLRVKYGQQSHIINYRGVELCESFH